VTIDSMPLSLHSKPTILSRHLTSTAAFLLSALALWVPSGYSYAALLLLLGAVCSAPHWLRQRPDHTTLGLALLLAGMGCVSFALSLDAGWARWDKGVKWLLGIPCLLYIVTAPPRPTTFMTGLPIGCTGMGLLALWQVAGQGLERANGYTNAIQWGNLALLLACLTAVCLAVFWRQRGNTWQGWLWRTGMALAVLLGTTASLLSQSRGGWLAVIAIFPLWLLLTWRIRPRLFTCLLLGLALLLALGTLVLAATPRLKERVMQAGTEITGYLENGNDNTSVGLRLAQYTLAAELIPEKPWLGWGAQGFAQEVRQRVEAGQHSREMLYYPQIHNDFLDIWVKVGVGGVLVQAALFLWVFAMFWPRRQHVARWHGDTSLWREAAALRIMGTTIPVGYWVFGQSQPFFNHNSGIMCFVFLTAVLWATLQGIEHEIERGNACPTG